LRGNAEPSGKPAACALARSRAEKLPFPFRRKNGAHKIKKCEGNFSARQTAVIGGWRRASFQISLLGFMD